VEYGLRDYGSRIADDTLTRTHAIRLTGLAAGTNYQVRAVSRVARGISAFDTATFRTTNDVTPPSSPLALRAVGQDRQIALEWTNPVTSDFSDVVVVARDDHFPLSPTDGRLVYVGSLAATIDTGLNAGHEYFYAVFARDRLGNASTGAIASARTWTMATVPGTVATSSPTSPVPVLPPLPVRRPATRSLQAEWRDGSGAFTFVAQGDGTFRAFSGQSVRVSIPSRVGGYDVTSAEVSFGDARYQLTLGSDDRFSAVVDLPASGLVRAQVFADLPDGTVAGTETSFVLTSRFHVASKSDDHPLAGVEVRILQQRGADWVLWDPRTSGQTNPFITKEDGVYGFFVEPGTYRILFRGTGFLSTDIQEVVSGNILGESVVLETASTLSQLTTAATQLLDTAQDFLASPAVQTANTQVVAPVVVVATVANLAAATSATNLLHYLYFLFTQPLLLIGRRKRKQWGIVYNSLSKQPLDLVVVRLVEAGTGRVAQTRITDSQGRYSFFVKPGMYRLQVSKPGFGFPTNYLAKDREDGSFLDLYHGEPIEVVHSAMLTANVPLDPPEKLEAPLKQMVRARRLRMAQQVVSALGVVASVGSFVISPGKFTGGMLLVQIATYAVFYRLAAAGRPKGWGMVYDAASRQTLGQTVVRIFDKRFNKLLETQVTDKDGRYAFFTGPNVYTVTAEKPGYEKFQSKDIDLTKGDERVVKEPIQLKKK
jgi:hypothetical protein